MADCLTNLLVEAIYKLCVSSAASLFYARKREIDHAPKVLKPNDWLGVALVERHQLFRSTIVRCYLHNSDNVLLQSSGNMHY